MGQTMPNIKTILAVIDPTTDEQPGLERAKLVAGKTGATLHLLICTYDEYLAGSRIVDSPAFKNAREMLVNNYAERLETLAEPLRKDGLSVHTSAIWEHPLHEGIIHHAVDIGADIVFKDTHHHSALARALFTNTDWNLIRTCPCLLWLVKPGEVQSGTKIVAAIDPMSEHDKPAALDDHIIKVTQDVSSLLSGELTVFHSYDPRAAFATATANAYVPVSLPLDEVEEQMHEQHANRVREITSYYDIDDAATHVVSGATHEVLPEFARDENVSAVVMGAVARGRLKRLFIGATAERTLENLPCDLVIVKPDGVAATLESAVA